MKNSNKHRVMKSLTKPLGPSFRKSILVASMLALSSPSAFATALGLTDVYQMALNHDAKLAQADSLYKADSQGVESARAALLPQIQADGSYFVTDSSIDSADVNARDLSLTLNQSLYQHSSWARYEQAKYVSDAALATFKNAEQDLILRVSQSYFDVLLAQTSLELSKTKEAADYTQYQTAQASEELGLSSRVDVLQAKSSYDLSKSETINAENNLDVALEALAKITGQSMSQLKNSGLKALLPTVALPKISLALNALEKQAEMQNLSVQQAQAQLATASEEIEVQRSGYWPTVALQAKYSDSAYSDYHSAYAAQFNDSNKTSVGVTVSMPLYSGGGTNSEVKAAKFKSVAAQQSLRDAQESARLSVRTQVLNIERGEQLILALKEAVKSNDAFLESAEEGYKVGLKSLLEVLTARTNQTNAHKNLIEALHNQVINRLKLEASLGNLTVEDLQVFEPLLQTVQK
ncbi:outer membrane channel protein TolC [Thiomicrorhabdus immobilis]|uniref:Outer membrane channel protein TolC n=1 Tax=Thiomicrorhabdus immobilis TaxID=2791037 RepID=A0ABN6D015_9GAMM|nr:TolC family outer membrane protein [Thiomicrorhabdus immobilis]BCN93462.1 outer membrane channel protein TolC [Thiomicrorhabdus immobilis]